jgi:hypothetical protein
MAGKPSHLSRVSLSHIVEIGLSQGPDGPDWDVQGTILNVAPVSTKYLSSVNSSVKKMRPAFAGKCMALAVACVWL